MVQFPCEQYLVKSMEWQIENNFNWWKCINNIYIVKSDKTASQVRDFLLECFDDNDTLFVVELSSPRDSAWYGLSDECSSWLQQHL